MLFAIRTAATCIPLAARPVSSRQHNANRIVTRANKIKKAGSFSPDGTQSRANDVAEDSSLVDSHGINWTGTSTSGFSPHVATKAEKEAEARSLLYFWEVLGPRARRDAPFVRLTRPIESWKFKCRSSVWNSDRTSRLT